VSSDAARLGTVVHAALAEDVLGQDVDIDAMAEEEGLKSAELGPLFFYGRRAWDDLKVSFARPEVEKEVLAKVGAYEITGHLDVFDNLGSMLLVLDWKSGSVHRDHSKQLATYALGAYQSSGQKADTVTCLTVWLQDGYYESKTFSASDLTAFANQIASEVFGRIDTYAPGDHCGYCPRFIGCPGRGAVVSSAVAELSDMLPATGGVNGVAMAAALNKVRMVEGVCRKAREFIKQQVVMGGPIPTKPGFALQIRTDTQEKIMPLQAWPILLRELTEEEMAQVLKVGKTALMDVVSAKAGKGQKGKSKVAVMDALRQQGALKDKVVESLRELPYQEKEQ